MLHAGSKGVAMYKCRWLWTVAYAAFALIALAGCNGPASTWQEESLHRNDGGYIGAMTEEDRIKVGSDISRIFQQRRRRQRP